MILSPFYFDITIQGHWVSPVSAHMWDIREGLWLGGVRNLPLDSVGIRCDSETPAQSKKGVFKRVFFFFLFPKPDDSASLLPCSSLTINQCVSKDLYNWELLLFSGVFLNLGWNAEENSQRWGMAGAESPAPWSECSDGWDPDTFSVLTEKNSGCSGACGCEGF